MKRALPKGWKRIVLDDIVATISAGVSVNAEDRNARQGEAGVLKTSCVTTGVFRASEHKAVLPRDLHRVSESLRTGSIVMSRMNTLALVGASAYVDQAPSNLYLPDRLWQITTLGHVLPKWLASALSSTAFRNRLKSVASGTSGSMKNISLDSLLQLIVDVPPMDEQRRIVLMLDMISRRSALTDRLLRMQRQIYTALLDQNARAAFQKRPPKGWRTVNLGDVLTERDERSANLPLLAITARQGLVPRDDIDRRDTSAADKSKYKVIRPGDLGYNTMRMWQGVCGLSRHHGIVSPAYTVVEPVGGKMLGEFAAHLFRHPRVIHTFRRYSQGLVDDTLLLKFPHFSEIRLAIPGTSEQTTIAAALDAQMAHIDAIKEHGRALRQQKRGLMQKLLSGEWRLTTDLPLPEMAHG